MRTTVFWLRWSLRDLRRRWVVVCALALVIAIGTGVAAAFGSLSQWRRLSNDASFALFGMHDLAVDFAGGTVDAGTAIDAIGRIPHASWLLAVEGRVDVPTQVEVVDGGRTRVLPGRIVGVDPGADGTGPRLDRVLTDRGTPAAYPATGRTLLVEWAFAEQYGLPRTGGVRVAGGTQVTYDGFGQSPRYLMNGRGAVLGEPTLAVLFTSLTEARRLAGLADGQVSEVLVGLRPGADPELVRTEIDNALAAAVRDASLGGANLGGAHLGVATRWQEPAYRMLYDDIDNDQRFWDLVSFLVLGGAALAVFNLANRVVSAQRREIGIGAALGARSVAMAARPALFGVQVAVLGTAAGAGVGLLLGWAITGILDDVLPLPVWRTPQQPAVFARSAALGVLIPLLGIAVPVVRAVRVRPAEAIRTAHIAGGSGRLARLLGHLPLPGSSIGHLPVRHVLRAPGRTAMTAAGVGAALAVLVTMLGLLDSLAGALDTGDEEQRRGAPGRLAVTLDGFHPVGAAEVTAVRDSPAVAAAQPVLRLRASVLGDGTTLDVAIDVLDFRAAVWTPTLRGRDGRELPAGTVPRGLVLAEKAAADLGVRPGDTLTVEHPRRTGGTGEAAPGFETVRSTMVVAAVHPYPVRTFAYLDQASAGGFGLTGFTNHLQVLPAVGVDEDGLRRALLGQPAVAGVLSVDAASRGMRDMMAQFTDLLALIALFILVLALLIAFNAASINADERTREYATMRAFGLRTGRVIGNAMVENLLVGLFGTGLGLAAGWLATWWSVRSLVGSTMPDFDLQPIVSAGTVLVAVAVGALAVTTAPLLTARKIRRTDIPAALRVVE